MNRSLAALLLLPAVALAAPVPKAKEGENKLYVTIDGRIVKMNPDGSDAEKLFDDEYAGGDMRVSPDGKRVAYAKRPKPSFKWDVGVREVVGEPKVLVSLEDRPDMFWSADSESLIGYEEDRTAKPRFVGDEGWKNWSVNVTSGKRTDLDVPAHYRVWTLRPDSKDFYYFAAGGFVETKKGTGFIRTEVATDVRKPEPKVLIPGDRDVYPLAAFPDGKRWVVRRHRDNTWGVYAEGEPDIAAWDFEARWPRKVAVCPNGKRVVYAVDTADKWAKKSQLELRIADADGKNSVTILKTDKYIGHIDWR